MKTCPKCRVSKEPAGFPRASSRADGLAPWCKSCTAEYHREYNQRPEVMERNRVRSLARYRKLPPEKKRQAAVTRDQRLRRLYGLTSKQYDDLLARQGSVCAICQRASGRPLVVDHDHTCCPGDKTCGRCVRGLLCVRCNTLLHALEADDWRPRAEAYLNLT